MSSVDLMRGSRYSHGGWCGGTECTRCYKYSCGTCGQRSNLMMSCLFCYARLHGSAASAVADASSDASVSRADASTANAVRGADD